jgi:hypothetical protein
MKFPLLFCLFIIIVFVLIKFRKKLLPEKKPAVTTEPAAASGSAASKPAVSEPATKPETPKKVYGKNLSIILLILFFSGISFFVGRLSMYRIYGVPSYKILKSRTSEFRGPWKLGILGPNESGSGVKMDPPQIVEFQSLEPDLVFSLSYVYKGKKQKAVYTLNEKDKKGFWSQTNPPEKGFLGGIEKMSAGFYSGWVTMNSMGEKRVQIWLMGKEIENGSKK